MTKADLINEIAIQTGYDKITITNVVEATMNNIKNSVVAGENVFLRGFGSFVTKKRAMKVARNIVAKTSIVVPEHNVPMFKPSPEFKDAVK